MRNNDALLPLFAKLVDTYGDGNVLHTFEICTNSGIELDNSTIDKIEILHSIGNPISNVLFYYNENTNDFGTINDFTEDDLLNFYMEIKDILEAKYSETVFATTNTILRRIFDPEDAEMLSEFIFDNVCDEVTRNEVFTEDYVVETAVKTALRKLIYRD